MIHKGVLVDNRATELFLAGQNRHVGHRNQAAGHYQLRRVECVRDVGTDLLGRDGPLAVKLVNQHYFNTELDFVAEGLSIMAVNVNIIFEVLCYVLGLEQLVVEIFIGGSRHGCVRELGVADGQLGPEVIVDPPCEHHVLEAKSKQKMNLWRRGQR